MLQLGRIGRNAGGEKAGGIAGFIEEQYWLSDDVVEVLFAVSRDSTLLTISISRLYSFDNDAYNRDIIRYPAKYEVAHSNPCCDSEKHEAQEAGRHTELFAPVCERRDQSPEQVRL